MGDIIREGTGEIVGDFDQYISFKSLIEGYFNNLDFNTLIERAETALRHPVAIVDIGMTIVSESTSLKNRPEFHGEGPVPTYNEAIISALRSEGFVHKIQHRKFLSTYIKNGEQSFVATSLSIDEPSVLILLVFENGSEITQDDMMNIKKASQLLVLALQKEIAINRIEPFLIHPVVKKIITGAGVDDSDIRATAQILKWMNDMPCHLMLIQTDTPGSLNYYMYSLATYFKQFFSINRFQIFEDRLVVPIPCSAYNKLLARRESFDSFLRYNQLYCVIGDLMPNIHALHYEYKKMNLLLNTCIASDTHIGLYAEMYFHVISSLIQRECPIQHFIHPAVLKLSEYDNENGTELSRTLYYYLEHNDYIEDVLNILGIKKSTLFYRLGKIKEITGLDIKSPIEKLGLHLSYKLLYAQEKLI